MNEQNSKSLLPIVLAIIITGVVVGGSMYWWNSTSPAKQGSNQITEKFDGVKKQKTPSAKSIFYSDAEHRFEFAVSNPACKKYLQVTKTGKGSQAAYSITLPLAKEWSGELMRYNVMTQTEYDGISNEEMPGKPKINLNLDNGLLLTHRDPQDSPAESDLPQVCGLWDIRRN